MTRAQAGHPRVRGFAVRVCDSAGFKKRASILSVSAAAATVLISLRATAGGGGDRDDDGEPQSSR
jgi:hypothetical protein